MKYCSAPWNTAHINYLGQLSSCFCSIFHNKKEIGSVLHHSILELYNSESQKEFRNSIIDQTFRYCREDTCVEFYRMEDLDQIEIDPNEVFLPTTIQLQIDPVCNLKCAICRTKNIYSTRARPTAVRVLERLVKEYQNFDKKVNIHCDGSGEVFVSRAYLDFFNSNNLPECFYFNIQTNGNLITKNLDVVDKLRNKITMIEVSLDAATAETYKDVRGGNFEIVLDGIRYLKNLGIEVWTQYVVQQSNYREIYAYVELCKQLGVDKICLQLMSHNSHMTQEWWSQNSVVENSSADLDFLDTALKAFKQDSQIEISGGLEQLIAKPINFIKC